MIRAIAHPTDFSPEGQMAFAHALRLAVVNRCALELLHVRGRTDMDHYERFPHVREVLQRWGLLAPHAAIEDIVAQTGVTVRKIEIRDEDAVEGLSAFLVDHRPDLIVMATHGRAGLDRWLHGSVSSAIARETRTPVLLIGPDAAPFVDPATGAMNVQCILTPVAPDPSPSKALRALDTFRQSLDARVDLVHVGNDVPRLLDDTGAPLAIRRIEGTVVDAILAEAESTGARLIAMPTAGHKGFLDALRGSTTERVVAQAPCPVLALPA